MPHLVRLPAADIALRRELYLFALYRMLEAALLALTVFGPSQLIAMPRDVLLAQSVAIGYLPMALVLLLATRHDRSSLGWQAMLGVIVDIVVALLITHAIPTVAPGVAVMLLFNVGAAALLVPLPLAMGAAALAAAGVLGEYLWTTVGYGSSERPFAEALMFSVSFFAIATVVNLLGRQMRQSHALADRSSAKAAQLTEVNGLIIRRMRTGVLLVDGSGFVRMANEAALMLLGDIHDENDRPRRLRDLSQPLAMRLAAWRKDESADDIPLAVDGREDQPTEVLPRFARLLAEGDTTLVFLDDTTVVSRRAESLTLAAMGRFSASLAHEIRNPLAAISYATQLLEESNDVTESDRRLLQIVHQQCMRTNGIVESVLGLARRERAQPEHVDLIAIAKRSIGHVLEGMPADLDSLTLSHGVPSLPGLVDPRHLQQVLTALLQNALRYGRMPGQAARIIVRVETRDGRPVIEVLDRGPGIPDAVTAQLFRPFFTTSEHGTGLGLYIANELIRANGATLDYVPVPGGGACFRIALPGTDALLTG